MLTFSRSMPAAQALGFPPPAHAISTALFSPLGSGLAVVLQAEDAVIRVTIYDADGTYAMPPTVFDWDDRINNNCVLRVETNGAGGRAPARLPQPCCGKCYSRSIGRGRRAI